MQRERFLRVLHFGIFALAPASVRWLDNEFDAMDQTSRKLHGSLSLSNGFPAKLLISAEKSTGLTVIDLNYTNSLHRFPDHIYVTYMVNETNVKPVVEYVVRKCDFGAADTDPRTLGFVNTNREFVEISNTLYQVAPAGRVTKVPPPGIRDRPGQYRRRLFIYLIAFTVCVPPALLLIKQIRRRGPHSEHR
jgi:hypothetical protein